MKRWVKVVIGVALLLVICVAALVLLVNANTFRPILENQLTAALGRPVTLGGLSFSPFTGSMVADKLQIAGDPSYGPAALVTAKQLRVGVDMKALILHRQLIVQSFTAEQPRINLIQNANGDWNFSTVGHNGAGTSTDSRKQEGLSGLSVGRIVVHNGTVVVSTYPAHGAARIYRDVNLSVHDFSFIRSFPFSLTALLPGQGTASAKGNAGPIDQQNAAATRFDAQLSIRDLNPVAAGFLVPSAGISMLADADANAVSDGSHVNSKGTLRLSRLQLVANGKAIPQPVIVTYDLTQELKGGAGELRGADLRTGSAAIHLAGSYKVMPENPSVNLNVSGQNLPIDELQSLMISAGVKLPNGAVLKGGTLTLGLNFAGPVDALVVTGPVALANTRLAGFNLGSKIAGIAALGGIQTGDTTEIQQLRFNLRAANSGIQTDNVYAVMPAVGQATGSGSISPAGALDYRLVVKVTTAHGLGKAGVGLLTKLNAMAGAEAASVAANGIPMLVTGTATNPVITADVNGMMRRNGAHILGSARKNNPGAVLRGLLGGK